MLTARGKNTFMGADLYFGKTEHFYDPDPHDWLMDDVLWWFGLSWEEDVSPLLDEQQLLSVHKIERLLVMLEERRVHFQDSMLECLQEDRPFFEKRAEELRDFLKEAVDLGQPIECSL